MHESLPQKSWMLRFADFKKSVHRHIVQYLVRSWRPEYLDLGGLGLPEPEVKTLVVGRFITSGGRGEASLCVYLHAGAQAVAVAARATKGNCEPMGAATAIHEDLRRTAQNGGNDVDGAVIVQVAESCASSCNQRRRARINGFEPLSPIQRQQRRLQIMQRRIDFFYVVENVPLRHEQILLPIVIEVFQTNTPTGGYTGKHGDAGLQSAITKRTVAIVVKHGISLSRQRGHDNVRKAIVIVILKHHTHARQRSAVRIQRGSSLKGNFFERAIAVVMKQILLHAVVCYIDVGESIAIVVGKGHPEAMPFLSGDARVLTYIFKSSVAPVVIKNVCGARKFSRRTIGVKVAAAVLAVLRVPFHVTRDEQVEFAVVVIIEKSGRDGPTPAGDPGLRGHIGERSVSIVVIENVPAVTGDVQIRIAIVVVVADRDAHAVVAIARISQTCLLRYISEGTVSILAVESIPIARIVTVKIFRLPHGASYVATIDDKNIEQAIVVVVQERDAAGHGLDEIFLRRG